MMLTVLLYYCCGAYQGESAVALARRFEAEFWEDLSALDVRPPHATTRVTEHVPDIIAFIQQILSTGFAYAPAGGDGVYFDTAAFSRAGSARIGDGDCHHRYGKLGGSVSEAGPATPLTLDETVVAASFKKDARDFALWKFSKAGESYWDAPWGAGRPGWHIECSAMIHAMFGQRIDVHGGGIDLR